MFLRQAILYLLFLSVSSWLRRVNDSAECYIIPLAMSLTFATSVLSSLTYSEEGVTFETVFEIVILSGQLVKLSPRVLHFMLLPAGFGETVPKIS